jgi:hypothetical protein
MIVGARIRFILPLVQVIIAAALIISNSVRPEPPADTIPSPKRGMLDIQYCLALNSPAAMIAAIQIEATHDLLWNYYPLYPIVNLTFFLSLVWLLWYAVSIEIGGKGLSVLTPKTGFRRVADTLAISLGIGVVIYADIAPAHILYKKFVSPVHLLWALTIIGFYGHDLWASFRRISGTGNPAPIAPS